MDDLKSYAEFVLGVYRALLVDCARHYPECAKEFDRDYKRLSSAIEQHGIRFTLDVMPSFRKHLDKCLREERLIPSHLIHFGCRHGEAIPRLFRGLTLRVFDRFGTLRHDPDTIAVKLLRQLLGAVRKLELSSNHRDTTRSIVGFFREDEEVIDGSLDWRCHDTFCAEDAVELAFGDSQHQVSADPSTGTPLLVHPEHARLVQQSADLITSMLGVFDPHEWRPKHGPGAVSDQRYGSYKYDFKTWPERLDSVFPYADFAFANYAQVPLIPIDSDLHRSLSVEKPAKLCAVPKTLSKPRLIASEPTSSQWCQQIIKDFFYSRVRDTLLSRFITFDDQEKNGTLALRASIDGSHATIDLSSASDRVSCWHVERLFRRSPSLLRALQSTRTREVTQDICRVSPKLYELKKYSTMGNATTFPVQSLLFLSMALGTLAFVRGQKVNFKFLRELGQWQVRVFGDDIIVPDDCSEAMVGLLRAFNMKVNLDKTCLTGLFRESCGVDAYGGQDVTSVSILSKPSTASPGSIVSSVDIHHNLAEAGLLETAAYIRKTAEPLVRNQVRTVKHRSGLFGWSDLDPGLPPKRVRWNPSLQISEVYTLRVRTREERRPAEESYGLLQYFIEAPRVVTSAVSTLGYLARRPRVGLALGWVSAVTH